MEGVKRARIAVIRALFVLDTLLEGPFFFWRNRRLFDNPIVYVSWNWSFGHSIAGLDFPSRLYYPHRISLIYLPHETSNEYLSHCFSHNIDPYIYRSRLLPVSSRHDGAKRDTLRFLLLTLSGLLRRFDVIDQFTVLKAVSLAEDRLQYGDESKGTIQHYTDWTGYIRLIRDEVGRKPRLPDHLLAQCRTAIQSRHPGFFEKPFATILLRDKGRDLTFEMASRCAGPHENYKPLVQYLLSNGYHVAGTGETSHAVFRDLPGYFSFENIDLPPKLLNLYLLTNCTLFIGQISGPHILPTSCGIRCLITDIPFYRDASFCPDNIVMFKHYRERRTNRLISIVEAFRSHQDLVYGCHFEKKGIEILPNTPEELMEAGKESLAALRQEMVYSDEDKRLLEVFRQLPAISMESHYQGIRTSIHVLRQLKEELLGDSTPHTEIQSDILIKNT
jgi:putative glycosyltransferase (TIGR04372 family)